MLRAAKLQEAARVKRKTAAGENVLRADQIVQVIRRINKAEDTFVGVRVASGKDHALYLVIDDLLIWNGYRFIRNHDVTSVQKHDHGDLYARVLESKGIDPQRVSVPAGDFGMSELFQLLRKLGVFAGFFFEEFMGEGDFFLGKPIEWTGETLKVLAINSFGEPYEQPHTLNIRALSRVDFLGEYERSFDLVVPSTNAP